MLQLILVRHGNTFETGQTPLQVGARTDLPLTEYGRQQAEHMAKYLLKEKVSVTALYAGRLKRQAEFAEIISRHLGLEVLTEPGLNEIDYGMWEGLPAQEIEKRWPTEYAEWNQNGKWPGGIFGGSYENHKTALNKWLNALTGCVVAVTSNGLLRFLQKEKIKTGHFCEFQFSGELKVIRTNVNPTE